MSTTFDTSSIPLWHMNRLMTSANGSKLKTLGHLVQQKQTFITLGQNVSISSFQLSDFFPLIPFPIIPHHLRRKARLTGLRGRSRHDLLMLRLRPRRPPPPPPPPRRGGERLSRRGRLSPRRGMATRWGATRRVGPGVVALLGQRQRAKQF